MLPLRYAGLWRLLSGLWVLTVVVAMLAPPGWFGGGEQSLPWFAHADKLLHALAFAALAGWFAGLFEPRRYLPLALALAVFGLMIEGAQFLVGYRTADWFDIGANTLGILVGLALALAGLGGWGLRIENWYSGRTQH